MTSGNSRRSVPVRRRADPITIFNNCAGDGTHSSITLDDSLNNNSLLLVETSYYRPAATVRRAAPRQCVANHIVPMAFQHRRPGMKSLACSTGARRDNEPPSLPSLRHPLEGFELRYDAGIIGTPKY
jgi:hypothetical protein